MTGLTTFGVSLAAGVTDRSAVFGGWAVKRLLDEPVDFLLPDIVPPKKKAIRHILSTILHFYRHNESLSSNHDLSIYQVPDFLTIRDSDETSTTLPKAR
jgi:hypothetical protein